MTPSDYLQYVNKEITAMELAIKHQVAPQTIYNRLKRFKSEKPYRRMDNDTREALRADLAACVPYSGDYKTVLQRYNLRSVTEALQKLKVTSLSELRHGPALPAVLKALGFVLKGNDLYRAGTPKQRLYIGDMAPIRANPVQWFRDHSEEVKKACISSPTHTKQMTPRPSKKLHRRYKTMELTMELLNSGYRSDDIRQKTGANYAARLRDLRGRVDWRNEVFTEKEREVLGC